MELFAGFQSAGTTQVVPLVTKVTTLPACARSGIMPKENATTSAKESGIARAFLIHPLWHMHLERREDCRHEERQMELRSCDERH